VVDGLPTDTTFERVTMWVVPVATNEYQTSSLGVPLQAPAGMDSVAPRVVPLTGVAQVAPVFAVSTTAFEQSSLAGAAGAAGLVNDQIVALQPIASEPPFVGTTYQ